MRNRAKSEYASILAEAVSRLLASLETPRPRNPLDARLDESAPVVIQSDMERRCAA